MPPLSLSMHRGLRGVGEGVVSTATAGVIDGSTIQSNPACALCGVIVNPMNAMTMSDKNHDHFMISLYFIFQKLTSVM